jgi:hypothetical protein
MHFDYIPYIVTPLTLSIVIKCCFSIPSFNMLNSRRMFLTDTVGFFINPPSFPLQVFALCSRSIYLILKVGPLCVIEIVIFMPLAVSSRAWRTSRGVSLVQFFSFITLCISLNAVHALFFYTFHQPENIM